MALIGFTVFKEKVLDGTKAQTIREPRKRPIRVGELLYLYWRLRRPDCELLRVARCSEVFTLNWGQMKDDLDLARRDGFDDLDSFRRWFARYNPDDETEFLVIRWDVALSVGVCPDCGHEMERRDVIRSWDPKGIISDLERVWYCKPCDVLWAHEFVDPETLLEKRG